MFLGEPNHLARSCQHLSMGGGVKGTWAAGAPRNMDQTRGLMRQHGVSHAIPGKCGRLMAQCAHCFHLIQKFPLSSLSRSRCLCDVVEVLFLLFSRLEPRFSNYLYYFQFLLYLLSVPVLPVPSTVGLLLIAIFFFANSDQVLGVFFKASLHFFWNCSLSCVHYVWNSSLS